MKIRKRMAWIMVPAFLVGVTAAGVAWSQNGEGRGGEGAHMTRGEGGEGSHVTRGEKRGGRHWHGHERRHGRGDRHGRGHEARGGRGGREGLVKRMTRKLELTEDQVEKVKGVVTEARKKRIGLRADARVAGIELREMLSQETVDKAGIDAKVDEIARIGGDLLRARTEVALAVREILTPEQMAKADGLLKRLLGDRKGRSRR